MSYTELRDRMRDEITKKLTSMDYSEASLDAYEHNNWMHRQAHKNGYRSACRQFLKLIDILDQEFMNERKPDGPVSGRTGAGSQ